MPGFLPELTWQCKISKDVKVASIKNLTFKFYRDSDINSWLILNMIGINLSEFNSKYSLFVFDRLALVSANRLAS